MLERGGDMELTQRQKLIFRTIVERFTCTAEPVGSKALMELLDHPLSSATIRNEMAVLERAGLLEKTHISSGRIPSRRGYRYYVENLMETSLPATVRTTLRDIFMERQYTLEEVVRIASDVLSEMTSLTSIVLGPDASGQRLQHVAMVPLSTDSAVALFVTDTGHTENKLFRFEQDVSLPDLTTCTDLLNSHLKGIRLEDIAGHLEELRPLMAAKLARSEVLYEAFAAAFMNFAAEKMAVSGRSNMLAQPEFSDVNRVRKLMKILEDSDLFNAWTHQSTNIAVPIGGRNELIQIGDCSVVTAKFRTCDEEEGRLMVVGPNRMPYARVIALTDAMSDAIEEIFGTDKKGGRQDEQTQEAAAGNGTGGNEAGSRKSGG